ncbi:MAG: Uncharacterised protein [Owenweeksia sp. TMED14]|nr:MAG: Uncharacterised protein [Owenweeksia sp. TMED14]
MNFLSLIKKNNFWLFISFSFIILGLDQIGIFNLSTSGVIAIAVTLTFLIIKELIKLIRSFQK